MGHADSELRQPSGSQGINAGGPAGLIRWKSQGSQPLNPHSINAPSPSALLADLFDIAVSAFELRGALPDASLHPDEAACVARAAPQRIAEFAAGRACARAALAQLEIRDFALRMGPDREPLWPQGIAGSITHTAQFCGAVVARGAPARLLGVDAEHRTALRPELWRHITTAEERSWLETLEPDCGRQMAALLFSAKESFFKCQYPRTRQWLGFNDVSVRVEGQSFQVLPRAAVKLQELAAAPWTGRFSLSGELLVTGICVTAAAAAASSGE